MANLRIVKKIFRIDIEKYIYHRGSFAHYSIVFEHNDCNFCVLVICGTITCYTVDQPIKKSSKIFKEFKKKLLNYLKADGQIECEFTTANGIVPCTIYSKEEFDILRNLYDDTQIEAINGILKDTSQQVHLRDNETAELKIPVSVFSRGFVKFSR